jgi:colanic acid/amylovoran biosynthesis glycosyltransferase
MRIAFVVGRFPIVSETFVLQQIQGTLARGHEVDIYATTVPRTGPLHPMYTEWKMQEFVRWRPEIGFENYGLIAKAIGLSVVGAMRSPVLLARCVLQSLRQGTGNAALLFVAAASAGRDTPRRYDAIHAHFAGQGLLAVRLRKLGALAGPILTSFHGVDITSHHLKNRLAGYRQLFDLGDAFTHPSDYIGARARDLGCPAARQRKLYCGVNTAKFPFRARTVDAGSPAQIVSVARLVEKKGLQYAITAAAQLVQAGKNLIYNIVGEGPLRPSLEALIRTLGVESRIRLVGAQDEVGVRRYLGEAHIFLLPSVTGKDGDMEGLPVSILEAQMCGLPVVSTLHSGIPEAVDDGRSAFLVPERDVDALAERLGYLIDHPETWTAMGCAGRAHVESHFDIEKLNDELVGIYGALMAGEIGKSTAATRP